MAELAYLGFGNRSTRAQLRDSPGTIVSNKRSSRNEECLLVEVAHGWSCASGVTVLSLIWQVLILINHTVPRNETVQKQPCAKWQATHGDEGKAKRQQSSFYVAVKLAFETPNALRRAQLQCNG